MSMRKVVTLLLVALALVVCGGAAMADRPGIIRPTATILNRN